MTRYRRAQYVARLSPSYSDLTLAFCAGLATASICYLVVLTIWN